MGVDIIPGVFPFERTLTAPSAEYAEARATGELAKVRMWDGSLAWVATSYDHVREILADNRFSAEMATPGYPSLNETMKRLNAAQKPFFIALDPPIHTRLRRMLTAEFAYAKIQAMRPRVTELVNHLTDELLAASKPADFYAQFALPLPSIVITELLGIPDIDHSFFQSRSNTRIALGSDPSDSIRAADEIRAYLTDLVAEKAKAPEKYDDIMGRLIGNYVAKGEMSREECMLTVDLLLLAGHETTANMATLGMLSILETPGVFETLRADCSRPVLRQTVEEMLRFHSVLQFVSARVAKEDVDVAGATIRKGEGVFALVSAANRDPGRFPNPDNFDITRGMSPHIAFGFGVHQCLGQPLARLELEIAFATLIDRVPTMRLAEPVEKLKFKKNVLVHALYALPITW